MMSTVTLALYIGVGGLASDLACIRTFLDEMLYIPFIPPITWSKRPIPCCPHASHSQAAESLRRSGLRGEGTSRRRIGRPCAPRVMLVGSFLHVEKK
jgi:hypothetical protein